MFLYAERDERTFTRKVAVMPSDVGVDGRIKLRSLLNYFQDTAGLAVVDVEGTTTELLARGYAWVLMKYEMELAGELPMLDTSMDINTFHDPNHGYNTLRVFKAYSGGKLIVSAKTSWLLIDVNSRRPVKPLAHIPGIEDISPDERISPDFREIPEYGNNLASVEIPVMFHDLDYNGHVNNAVYFEWVHDYSPVDLLTHSPLFSIRTVCASFRSGARLGERVTLSFGEIGGATFICNIKRPNVSRNSASFLCEWREIDAQ